MALVTEIQNGAAAPPPQTTKKGGGKTGRPRDPRKNAAPSPPDVLEIDDSDAPLFEKMQMYPPEEWESKLFAYLYRMEPIIDRGRTGNYHNLQRFSKPFTLDEIMRSSYGGSGKYKIVLNRFDPGTRQTRIVQEYVFSILNSDFPPRIPYGEWINDDKNKDWAWAKPQLEKLGKEAETIATSGAAAAGITDPTFGAVFNILERFMPKQNSDQTQALASEVIKTMREQHQEQMAQAKGNPDQLVTLVTTIATALKPAAAAGGDSVVAQILENMRADLKESRELNSKLMERLFTPPPPPPPAPTLAQQLKDMVELKGSISQLFGRGNPGGEGAARKTDWGEVVARSVEKIVEEGPRYMQAIFTGRPPARTINHTRPAAGASGDAAPNGEPRELTQAEQEEHAMGAIQEINAQFGATFDEFTPELVKTFDRELSGMDFRDWFIDEFGARIYSFLRKMDVRTILGVIELRKTTAPEHLRPQLALLTPPAKVEQFILEFQSSEPAPTYGEEEETSEPAAATQTAPREKEF